MAELTSTAQWPRVLDNNGRASSERERGDGDGGLRRVVSSVNGGLTDGGGGR